MTTRLLIAGFVLSILGAACGEGSGEPGAAQAAEQELAESLDEDLPGGGAPSPPSASKRRGTWTAPLSGIIERWRGRAVKEARGALLAGDVEVSMHVLLAGRHPIELATLEADVARRPASNMKLVTTAAALVLLGPHQEFLTPFEALGPIEDGVLRGDLVARAAGDPFVRADGDGRIEPRLDALAEQLRSRGIRRITGDLVLDEGRFLEPGPAPGWPDESQYWQAHCALAAGFTLNGGLLQARVRPAEVGPSARVAVHPSPHGLKQNYGVKTHAQRLDVRVGATATTVTVRGTVPSWKPLYDPEFAHPDPVGLFGSVLRDRLLRAGIALDGSVVRRRGVAQGERVGELRSPVDATLGPINRDSHNGVADQLFLALGNALEQAGTREAAARASKRALEQLGVPTQDFRQIDGSGLSRDNRVSARQLSALLSGVLARDDDATELMLDSLALAGETGTLEERMRAGPARGRVRAKTGWIKGVSSLSGFCETLAGETLVFSILVEYPPELGGMNTRIFKPMQDELLETLVEADA